MFSHHNVLLFHCTFFNSTRYSSTCSNPASIPSLQSPGIDPGWPRQSAHSLNRNGIHGQISSCRGELFSERPEPVDEIRGNTFGFNRLTSPLPKGTVASKHGSC